MVSTQSMLIPKLKLLSEYVNKQKRCPNYIKFFLFRCWTDNKNNLLNIRSSSKLATYSTPYDIQFYLKDIDLVMARDIKLSKKPAEKFNNLVAELKDFRHHIYSDESKDSTKCGFGVYAENLIEASHIIDDKASIYSAESVSICMP